MGTIIVSEEIMDLTDGYLDFVDGKLCHSFYDCDNPTFDELIKTDFLLDKNFYL